MNRIASLILARGRKIFSFPFLALITLLVGSRGSPPISTVILTVIVSLAATISVYIYNDVCDLKMDRSNPQKRSRPLPSGKVTVKEAMRLAYISGFIALALSVLVNVETFIICASFIALALMYSTPRIHLKRRFLIKEMVTALGFTLTCLLGGAAVGSISVPVIFLAIFYFGYGMIGLPIDGIYDVVEDTKYGFKTISMVLPWKRMVQLFIFFLLAIVALAFLTYRQLGFNTLFPIGTFIMCGLSIYLIFPFISHSGEALSLRMKLSLHIPWIMIGLSVVLGTLTIPF